jgi:hypothetical protein
MQRLESLEGGAEHGEGWAGDSGTEDALGVFKGLLWALPVSLYLWWLIWLAWRAYVG